MVLRVVVVVLRVVVVVLLVVVGRVVVVVGGGFLLGKYVTRPEGLGGLVGLVGLFEDQDCISFSAGKYISVVGRLVVEVVVLVVVCVTTTGKGGGTFVGLWKINRSCLVVVVVVGLLACSIKAAKGGHLIAGFVGLDGLAGLVGRPRVATGVVVVVDVVVVCLVVDVVVVWTISPVVSPSSWTQHEPNMNPSIHIPRCWPFVFMHSQTNIQ